MLEIKNISKSYKTLDFEQQALKEVSLKFRINEFVAILGPSGSGKTTLLNIIGGLDRYDSGDLIINNKSTKEFDDTDWDAYRNNCIGFVFQSYNLIPHINLVENIEMGMVLSGVNAEKRRKKALGVLERVGLLEHAYKKPNQLSGGQMQRVAIARAIVNDPDIILADEPTGALDSDTSVQILDLIKEIAKDKLVIMVTHNSDLAHEYANRIVEFKDGRLVNDSNPIKNSDNTKQRYSIKKTAMSFWTALKLSFHNIVTKKGRTLITAFASSIGIIGIALILSLSNGFNIQIDKFESDTLSSFPISIMPTVANVDEEDMKQTQNEILDSSSNDKNYPNVNVVYPYDITTSTATHTNLITEEYIKYIENLDSSLLSGIAYYRLTALNLLGKIDNKVSILSSTAMNLTSLPKEFEEPKNYVQDGYDLLYGNYPSKISDVIIIVDNKNRIDTTLLTALGLDPTREEIKFDELVGKEFKLILNDDFYTKVGNLYIPKSDVEAMYNNKNSITLNIVGVVRGKQDNKLASMTTILFEMIGRGGVSNLAYSNELIEYVIENNKNSAVVKAQEQSDIAITFGGSNFQDINATKEQILSMLGAYDSPLLVTIYPKDFSAKDSITEYLDKYNEGKELENQIIYTDYAKEFSEMSSNVMDAVTIVLIAFSAISLIVSSIMIGIITYISVLERTKEIGILRALGARKKDISRVFNAETFIIGITSGVIGISIALLLIIPINKIIYNLTNLVGVAKMNPLHALILMIVSVSLTVIGGLIPARMASKKDPVIALRTE